MAILSNALLFEGLRQRAGGEVEVHGEGGEHNFRGRDAISPYDWAQAGDRW